MILRNGVRSTLRARGRSVLFTLLILLLTLALGLGLGMYAYSAATLADMDARYTSVALFEYMGALYPDADAADDSARAAAQALDPAALAAVPGVTLWEPTDQTLASLEGYERASGPYPWESAAVLTAYSFSVERYRAVMDPWEGELPSSYVMILSRSHTAQETGELFSTESEAEVCLDGVLLGTDLPLYYDYGFGNTYIRSVFDPQAGDLKEERCTRDELPDPCVVRSWGTGERPIFTYYDRAHGVARELTDVIQLSRHDGVETSEFSSPPFTTGVRYVPASYRAIVGQCLYSLDGRSNYSITVSMPLETLDVEDMDSFTVPSVDESFGFAPQPGEKYLLHGSLSPSTSAAGATFTFSPLPDSDEPPYRLLSGNEDSALADSAFTRAAAYYRTVNNYVRVTASDDVSALEEFHQQQLTLAQGRFPQPGEAGACVVDGDVAQRLGIELGDSLSLTRLASQEWARYRAVSVTDDRRAWTVVGITNLSTDYPYPGSLWVSGAEGGFQEPLFGYTLARAVLDNVQARSAADRLQALCPDGVRVTLYDQGYSAAAQPMEAMETTALAVTAASLCAALAVLVLFAFLFVGRQRETVEVLASLGTPQGKIRLWLLSGATVLVAAAALVGAVLSRALLGRILDAALTAARSLYAVDERFSESAVGVSLPAASLDAIPGWPAWAAGLGIFCAALLLCLLFLGQALRRSAPRRGRRKTRAPKGATSVRGRGAGRFALLSARRGGRRSAVVPAAALALALLLGVLASGAQGWQAQMDALYDTSAIEGQVSSTNGRQYTNLSVDAPTARALFQSGLIRDLSVGIGWNYLPTSSPVGNVAVHYANVGDSVDWVSYRFSQQPKLVALSSLRAAPGLYYEDDPGVEWLEGWDESFLSRSDCYSVLRCIPFPTGRGRPGSIGAGAEWLTYPCVAGRGFMEAQGLGLGDEFNVEFPLEYVRQTFLTTVRLKIVGSYQELDQSELYVPLSFWLDPAALTGPEDPLPEGGRTTHLFENEEDRDAFYYANTHFSTCRFTLKSARELDALRDFLTAQGFSQVGSLGRNRTTIVLRDQSFTEAVGGLGRYLSFSELLFPALFLAVGVLGFVLSWLMVNARRMEFAILRGLGASRGRVFWSFFLEQAGLCALGVLSAGLLLTALGAGWAGWLASGGFLLCYLLGCALSVLAVGRTPLMALLSERE